MGKKSFFFCLLLLMAAGWQLLSQSAPRSKTLLMEQYRQAEKRYNLENPTAADDSLALLAYESIAAQTENEAASAALAADCHIKAGTYHQYYLRLPQAIAHYRNALWLNTKYLNDSTMAYMGNLHLGTALYVSSVIDSASIYLEKAAAFADRNKNLPEQETLYNSLGVIYYESADFSQAKNYFSRALSVASGASPTEYNEAFASFTNNIANCLTQLGRYDEALQQYRLLLQRGQLTDKVMQNMGHTYFEMKQYDSALFCFSKVPVQQNIATIKMLNETGRIYIEQKKWAAAEQMFDSAITINSRVTGTVKNRNRAKSYLYRSLLAQKQGLYDEAITWVNNALRELHFSFNNKNAAALPPDVVNVVSAVGFMEALHQKATLFSIKYSITGEAEQLVTALKAYMLAIDAGNYIKRNFDNDEAKLFFNNTYSPLYHEAAQVAWQLHELRPERDYADMFLRISENYKGSILYQNLEQVRLKELPGISPQLIAREKELKKLLAFYTTRLNENDNETAEASLQQRFNELQVELSRVQQAFEAHPQYQFYKYHRVLQNQGIASVQKTLDAATAVISYISSDTLSYCLAISRNKYKIVRIALDAAQRKEARQFIRSTYDQTEGLRYNGYKAGAQLYRHLFTPVESVTAPASRWVVMPDNWICYLPFDALITNEQEKRFVAQDKIISYHYSFLLLQARQPAKAAAGTLAAFAPYAATAIADSLPALPYSLREVQLAGGKQYVKEAATRQQFLQQAASANILHLATHARAGTARITDACIYFYPQQTDSADHRLYLHEVYNLPLQSCRLVILSACETAGGEQATGEGLLSLSRAFLYAGCDGIVSTLWRTEDQVSAYLMQRLHHYLNKGEATETALTKAKRDFLREPGFDPRFKAPNYWSNFVYVGSITPIHTSVLARPVTWLAFLLAGALIFFQLKRKRSVKGK